MVGCFPSLSKALGQIFDSVKKKKKMKKKRKRKERRQVVSTGGLKQVSQTRNWCSLF